MKETNFYLFKVYMDGKFIGDLKCSDDGLYCWMPCDSETATSATSLYFLDKTGPEYQHIPFFNARLPRVIRNGEKEYWDHGTNIYFERVE